MNEVYCNFWVLVVTHLLSAPIVLGLVYLLRGVAGQLASLVPGLEARSVRGAWKASFQTTSQKFIEQVEVSQFLHWVWGTITDNETHRKYSFRGRLREKVFVATYEVEGDRAALDLGSFTLRLEDNGKKLKGSYAWLDRQKADVDNGIYVWERTG
jgi:hypothetical protein